MKPARCPPAYDQKESCVMGAGMLLCAGENSVERCKQLQATTGINCKTNSVKLVLKAGNSCNFAPFQSNHLVQYLFINLNNLIIDIGNTRTKAALFCKDELVRKEVWEKPTVAALKQLAYNQNPENAILSSTANVPVELEQYLQEKFRYIRLQTDTPLPIPVQYQTPNTLGRDRIAAAAGAAHLFPGKNVLVIDAGTCITMDLVTETGGFAGGNIAPGVEMRLKAMHHFTANLPLVDQGQWPGTAAGGTTPASFLGNSTETAIRNGGVLGALLEVTSFMEKCRRRYKPLTVVFTGGDADFFVKNIKTKIFANQNLVLIGLNKILQHNVEKF